MYYLMVKFKATNGFVTISFALMISIIKMKFIILNFRILLWHKIFLERLYFLSYTHVYLFSRIIYFYQILDIDIY